jgi:hypothetical protein
MDKRSAGVMPGEWLLTPLSGHAFWRSSIGAAFRVGTRQNLHGCGLQRCCRLCQQHLATRLEILLLIAHLSAGLLRLMGECAQTCEMQLHF